MMIDRRSFVLYIARNLVCKSLKDKSVHNRMLYSHHLLDLPFPPPSTISDRIVFVRYDDPFYMFLTSSFCAVVPV